MLYGSLVIKIFSPMKENFIRKETRDFTLEGEIFRSGNELFHKWKEEEKKGGTSFEYSLASFAISTRAKISGIHLEWDPFRSIPPSLLPDSPCNLEFHRLVLRSIHGFSSRNEYAKSRCALPTILCPRTHKHYRFECDVVAIPLNIAPSCSNFELNGVPKMLVP